MEKEIQIMHINIIGNYMPKINANVILRYSYSNEIINIYVRKHNLINKFLREY